MGPIAELSYVVIAATGRDGWRALLGDVAGLAHATREDGADVYRHDDRAARVVVVDGEVDDVDVLGWEVRSEADLDGRIDALRGAGVEVSVDPKDRRGPPVRRSARFTGPADVVHELVVGAARAPSPETPRVPGGFVAGDLGLGHAVVRSSGREETEAFYRQVLDFRLSDYIRCTYYGHDVDLAFLHCNLRHHSLAIGGRLPRRVHHLMVEHRQLDDVGAALDRAVAAGIPLRNTLGRHPNDQMISFYAIGPGGLELEIGCGARTVDAAWTPGSYDRISDWGHHPPQVLAPRRRDGGRP